MHGTIGTQQGARTPVRAFGATTAPPASDTQTVGKTEKPAFDPRTKSYIEG